MNAVRAPGPGDSYDRDFETSERRDEKISIEYRRIHVECLGDSEFVDQAMCDAMNAVAISQLNPSDYGYSTSFGIEAFAMEKAQSLLMRKKILHLLMTGEDDTELGWTIRKASSWAIARECLRLAVREVNEKGGVS